jgi:hypothetical protein
MRGRLTAVTLAGALIAGSGGLAFAQTPYPSAQPAWRTQGLRATRALNLLENQTDGQFSNFSASGADFTADVTKDGKTTAVLVRPDRHQIQPLGNAG